MAFLREASTRSREPVTLLQGTMSHLAQSIFRIKDEPLRYTDQSYFLNGLDDTSFSSILYRTSRQIGKSTFQSVRQLLPSIRFPKYNTLYVAPSFKQTREYSQTRVDPLIIDSDYVQAYRVNKLCKRGVETKTFTNGSRMMFRYAFYTPDRARGLSADLLLIDEVQDIRWENVPVIEHCLDHSKPPSSHPEWAPFYRKKIYSGTPKSNQNTIENLWKKSTQCMWVVPCFACGRWNHLDDKSIGKFGTICSKATCRKSIDPRYGRWQVFKPEGKMLGFHINALMAPRKDWGPHGWIDWYENILAFQDDKVTFFNEVLGLPCDNASRMLTEADLRICCDESWSLFSAPTQFTRSHHLFAGIDWGETRSRTVLTIGGYFGDTRFTPIFMKVYRSDESADPENILIPDILKWLHTFGVQCVACDVGHGWGLNSKLMTAFGMDRVFPIRYMGHTSPRLKFASKDKHEWVCNRNQIIGEFAMDVKRGNIRLPKWAEFEGRGYHKDLLAVFLEFSARSKQLIYAHNPDEPDDILHSIIYARIASELMTGMWSMDES